MRSLRRSPHQAATSGRRPLPPELGRPSGWVALALPPAVGALRRPGAAPPRAADRAAERLTELAREIADQVHGRASHLRNQRDLGLGQLSPAEFRDMEQGSGVYRRLIAFQPRLGSELRCPRCWVREEKHVPLRASGGTADVDVYRCPRVDEVYELPAD